MLTSLLRLAGRWLSLSFAAPNQVPFCVPEWSEAMAERHASIWRKVKPYTMTSVERVVALCQSIAYLEAHQIPGAIVECGVWKGGSMMASALSLLALESTQRQLYLYDTFMGMPEAGQVDIDLFGRPARDLMRQVTPEADVIRARCSLREVKQALMQTRYPWEKIHFVPGRIEATLPDHAPGEIALLRLDTDWYESTYHELKHLYPRLVEGGVLIVDDYGHWQGAKKAVDDYFRKSGIDADLRTIDYTGRLLLQRPRQTLPTAA
jgi:O-methyltransferase